MRFLFAFLLLSGLVACGPAPPRPTATPEPSGSLEVAQVQETGVVLVRRVRSEAAVGAGNYPSTREWWQHKKTKTCYLFTNGGGNPNHVITQIIDKEECE